MLMLNLWLVYSAHLQQIQRCSIIFVLYFVLHCSREMLFLHMTRYLRSVPYRNLVINVVSAAAPYQHDFMNQLTNFNYRAYEPLIEASAIAFCGQFIINSLISNGILYVFDLMFLPK